MPEDAKALKLYMVRDEYITDLNDNVDEHVFVEEYGKDHGMCERYVYEEKDRVLEKMRLLIERKFYEEDRKFHKIPVQNTYHLL